MGDADDAFQKLQQDAARDWADKGKLIEAGWVVLRARCVPRDAPQHVLDMFRFCYMAGAQHLFAMMLAMLEEGDDATDADSSRMNKIGDELSEWAAKVKADGPG